MKTLLFPHAGRLRHTIYVVSLGLWLATVLSIVELSAQPFSAARLLRLDPSKPNAIAFAPTSARFVRVWISETEGGQPCLDEFEIYGTDGGLNLALESRGAKATASSCLAGYPIHQTAHLNDGQYGNDHSWIAAGLSQEWAQIELAETATVAKVVLSRDRAGRYTDRVPSQLEVQLSPDGKEWTSVSRVGGRIPLPAKADPESLLRYAFLCEQATWSRIDPDPPVVRVRKQTEQMLQRLAAKGVDVTAERHALRAQSSLEITGSSESDLEQAYLEARLAKRHLFLRDPDLAALQRVLFVARHPYEPSHNYSDILDAQWRPGGGVQVLSVPWQDGRLAPEQARVTTLFDARDGVARDAMASSDATHIYFAYRNAPNGYFHVRVTDVDGRNERQLTDGPFHDYYPCPLPDGGVTFISTRCRARFLCWRPQAFVLFRMEANGSGIQPLSHANLSEWAPSVMRDGRILWTRSEYLDKGADFGHTLWAIHPDGTQPELLFGNNTLNCYVNAREVPGTSEFACTLISHGGDLNGPIGLIDRRQGRFNSAAITNITPDCPPHYHMSWAQRECFRDPVPISRDLFLVSHAPQNHFGLYVIDRYGNRELLYLDPTISSMCPTPLRAEPAPPVLAAAQAADANAELGQFVVQDIYQGLAPRVPRGTIKYLRVCQEVRADLEQLPSGEYRQDHPPFEDFYASPTHLVKGPNGWPSYVAKASLGLVPVETDGSASFFAPAGKVLYFEALDENLTEIQRMRSVVQLQPGERRGCVGCHEHRSSAPARRSLEALRQPPRELQAPPWGAVPFAYERVVQPVWDSQCVRCHDAKDTRRLDFTGTLGRDRVPASYRTLITQGWVHYFDYTWGREHNKAEPLTFGTSQSKLWRLIEAGHYDVKLSRDEMHRVKCWIDLNCPLWPDYLQRELRPGAAPQTARVEP